MPPRAVEVESAAGELGVIGEACPAVVGEVEMLRAPEADELERLNCL